VYQKERAAFWYGAHIERVQNTVRRGQDAMVANDESVHRGYIEAWKSTTEVLKSLPEDVLGLRLHVQLINYFLSRGEALMLSDLLPCCANLLRLNPPNGSAEQQGDKVAKLAQKLDQLQPFIVYSHRNAWTDLHFWSNLTPLSLKVCTSKRSERGHTPSWSTIWRSGRSSHGR
jgi:hypothetical protein